MTIGCTVAANGKKLPLQLVGKGKTQVSLAKFRINAKHIRGKVKACVSESGWSKKHTMIHLLDTIIIPSKGKLACMTWDTYNIRQPLR